MLHLLSFLQVTWDITRPFMRLLKITPSVPTCPLYWGWIRYGKTVLWGHKGRWERNWKPNKTHKPKTLMSFQSQWPTTLSRRSQPNTTGSYNTGKSNILVPQRSSWRCLCISVLLSPCLSSCQLKPPVFIFAHERPASSFHCLQLVVWHCTETLLKE